MLPQPPLSGKSDRISDSQPQLVIFDCDGVLVDSASISANALSGALKELGLDVSPEEARQSYLGPRLSEIARRIESEIGHALPSDWLGHFEARRVEMFRQELRAMHGAEQAVEDVVAASIPVCVASQGSSKVTHLKLEVTGLARFFAAKTVFSATEVARGKPFPDLFLHAASSMGFSPQLCAVVEDTEAGIAAAKSARMRVLAVSAGGDQTGLSRAGVSILRSLTGLTELLKIP
jgi:HAD superfamily hydrolase (TIGR01509 family)